MFFIIIITYPEIIENENEIINSLFESGLQCLHIRKPEWTEERMSLMIHQINEEHRKKIMIHSHYKLAFEYKLKGIHITSNYIKKHSNIEIEEIINCVKKNKMNVSTSCHKPEEIKNLQYSFDYIFLSPVFDSISKPDYNSAFNINELKKKLKSYKSKYKIIALGGIEENNIKSVFETGFNGAALLGAIWKNENKIGIFKKINESIISK